MSSQMQLFKMTIPNLVQLGYKNPELQWFNNASTLLINNKHTNNSIFHSHFSDLSYDIKYKMVLKNLKATGFPIYFNDIYRATIVTSLLRNGFDSWADSNVHLDYHIILHNFYSQSACISSHTNLDAISLGNKLLSHQFIKPRERDQLQHFRSIQRDSTICTSDIHQLLMSMNC